MDPSSPFLTPATPKAKKSSPLIVAAVFVAVLLVAIFGLVEKHRNAPSVPPNPAAFTSECQPKIDAINWGYPFSTQAKIHNLAFLDPPSRSIITNYIKNSSYVNLKLECDMDIKKDYGIFLFELQHWASNSSVLLSSYKFASTDFNNGIFNLSLETTAKNASATYFHWFYMTPEQRRQRTLQRKLSNEFLLLVYTDNLNFVIEFNKGKRYLTNDEWNNLIERTVAYRVTGFVNDENVKKLIKKFTPAPLPQIIQPNRSSSPVNISTGFNVSKCHAGAENGYVVIFENDMEQRKAQFHTMATSNGIIMSISVQCWYDDDGKDRLRTFYLTPEDKVMDCVEATDEKILCATSKEPETNHLS